MIYEISGHYKDEGGILEPGTMLVESGCCPESGGKLTARRYVECGMEFYEVTNSKTVAVFLADTGECERAGLSFTA